MTYWKTLKSSLFFNFVIWDGGLRCNQGILKQKYFQYIFSIFAPMRFRNILESTKFIFEILAIIAAGWWAIYSYILKDSPSLEESIQVTGNIVIEPYNSVKSLATFEVTVTNIGKSSFDIDSSWGKLWVLPVDSFFSSDSSGVLNIEEFIHSHLQPTIRSNDLVLNKSTKYYQMLEKHYFPGFSNKMQSPILVEKCECVTLVAVYWIFPSVNKKRLKPIVHVDFKVGTKSPK